MGMCVFSFLVQMCCQDLIDFDGSIRNLCAIFSILVLTTSSSSYDYYYISVMNNDYLAFMIHSTILKYYNLFKATLILFLENIMKCT